MHGGGGCMVGVGAWWGWVHGGLSAWWGWVHDGGGVSAWWGWGG